jgi:hypothetical protein
MSDSEENQQGNPQEIWSSQDEENEGTMHIAENPGDLRAIAQSRKRLQKWLAGTSVAVAVLLEAGLLYNVYAIDQPWIRLGQAWTLGVIAYLIAQGFAGHREGILEPCAQYLALQHEERRRGYLRLRKQILLFIPGILACAWGRLLSTISDLHAVQLPPTAKLQILRTNWLFVMTGIGLMLVWIAFGKAAGKAARDREQILQIARRNA